MQQSPNVVTVSSNHIQHSKHYQSRPHDKKDLQATTLRSNFRHKGCFLEFIDFHPMLDCGPDKPGTGKLPFRDPFRKMPSDSHNRSQREYGASTLFALAQPVLLREEFFGGIAFERVSKRAHYLDSVGFRILRNLADSSAPLRVKATTATEETAVDDLIDAGLIHSGVGASSRFIAAKDNTVNFLQAPLLVEIELTLGCFRSCRHCAYSSSPTASRAGELTADQWSRVFTQLAEMGVAIVQFTGGDPFFRQDFPEILATADECGLAIYPRSDTAAISPKHLQALKGLQNLWLVGTSCDGADTAMHNWMRGEGAFETFVRRAEALAAAEIPLVVGATLHAGNFKTVREIGRLATSLGAKYFDIGFLAPVGRAINMQEHVCSAYQIEDSLYQYLEGLSAGDYFAFQSHYETRLQSGLGISDLVEILPHIPYMTEWPFSRMRIDPTGNVYTAGKVRGSVLARGYNVLHDDVNIIWHDSPNLNYLRQAAAGCRVHTLDYRTIGEYVHV
jgi:pyrroloquinoline quinone biosynthesis protein E